MSCPICREFQGRTPITDRNETASKGYTRHHIVQDFSWRDLTQSAKSCYCCTIILKGCRATFSQRDVIEDEITACSLKFFYPRFLEDVDKDSCEKHITFGLHNGQTFEVEIFCAEGDETDIPESWDYFPTLTRTSPATDSEEVFETINTWIDGCEEDDEPCQLPEESELPKRVIDVGVDDGTVRLVETDGRKERYICLSHCWGLEQIITTTLSTIEHRKKNIVWEELSKTFQDAIRLTRKLGFTYIWIDSLCIIQDSAADWAVESAKMASVYSNGYLTIAGTKSSNGRGGLFNKTPDVRVAGQSPNGEDYAVYFRQYIDHQLEVILGSHGHTATETYYPLLSRAWVYQERMLSTRFLHFGHYEVFFECKTGIACECGGISMYNDNEDSPVPLVKLEYATALESYAKGYKGHAAEKVAYYGERLWRTMVCCYTALRLTKSKDRLAAFGGLAKQMQGVRNSRYLAGLWEDSLQDDLIWTIRTDNCSKPPRPEPRNAPTWSWASVESAAGADYWDSVVFTDLEDGGFDEPPLRKHYTRIEQCDVVKHEAAVDEFGPIELGKLTITGLAVDGEVQSEVVETNGEKEVIDYIVLGDKRLPFASDYALASDPLTTMILKVLCLRLSLIYEGEAAPKEILISLVVRKMNPTSEVYERIGSLSNRGQKGTIGDFGGIFETAEERTLVIR